MTKLLKQAFEEASKLDGPEQDAVAKWLLNKIASEPRFDAAFERSPDILAKLADEARAESRAGRTHPIR